MTLGDRPGKALFWGYDSDEPSFRHRMLPLSVELERRGWSCVIETVPKGHYWRRIRERRDQLRAADVVILHRVRPTPVEYRLLRRLCQRLVYDVDDAIYYRRPRRLGEEPDRSWFRQYKFDRTCGIADLVIAGNRTLAQRVARSAAWVEVLPTPVELARYETIDGRRTAGTLVWIGLPENLVYLDLVRPAMERLARERSDFRFRIVSAAFPEWPEVALEKVPWSADREASDLCSAGIGIMPLPDDGWTRGKCAFKLIQYMAAALPGVGSAVGANREVVEEGRTGLLVNGSDEWYRALRRLLDEPERATAMGLAGRERVRTHFDTRIVSARAAELIETLASRPADSLSRSASGPSTNLGSAELER